MSNETFTNEELQQKISHHRLFAEQGLKYVHSSITEQINNTYKTTQTKWANTFEELLELRKLREDTAN